MVRPRRPWGDDSPHGSSGWPAIRRLARGRRLARLRRPAVRQPARGNQTQKSQSAIIEIVQYVANDARLLTFISVAASTIWDLAYAIYLYTQGHSTGSIATSMTSIYYFSLVGVRACASVGFLAAARAKSESSHDKAQSVAAFAGGVFPLTVNAATAFVIVRAKSGWQVANNDIAFYVQSAYTVISLILAARGWQRYHRDESPLVPLTKGVSLCEAVMTLFFMALSAIHDSFLFNDAAHRVDVRIILTDDELAEGKTPEGIQVLGVEKWLLE